MTFELAPEPVPAWLCIPATALCSQVVLLAWLPCILSGLSSRLGVGATGVPDGHLPGPEIARQPPWMSLQPRAGWRGSLAPLLGLQCWRWDRWRLPGGVGSCGRRPHTSTVCVGNS